MTSLTERIRAKTEEETREVETLIREQLKRLSVNFTESSSAALSTTENAIRDRLSNLEEEISSRCRIMSLAFGKKLLQAGLLSFSLALGACLAGWGLITQAEKKVLNLQQKISELSARKESLEKTIASWPLTLKDRENGRFIIPFPPHTLKGNNWTSDGQQAWKLE
jgi:hypothetical protein